MNENDWPAVQLTRVESNRSPEWSGLREVQPVFERHPYREWCRLFYDECENSDSLEWMGAGFARCKPDDVDSVEASFRVAVDGANRRFRDLLSRNVIEDTHAAIDFIRFEGALAASADPNDPGYLCVDVW